MIYKVLIVGNPQQGHVGGHFLHAAQLSGMKVQVMDTRKAWAGNEWRQKVYYHLLNKRPTNLGGFGQQVIEKAATFRPSLVLATGIAPLHVSVIRKLRDMGTKVCNYLTDDPWNPKNSAGFFFESLPEYDWVFNPRKANISDIKTAGCANVEYLPFAYNPSVHFSEGAITESERERFSCDVAFIGGGDDDRLPLARAILDAGLSIRVYGGYWDKFAELRDFYGGFVHGREFRLAITCGSVNLCMGRKANRDGHAMRSFELPAVGAAMVVEKTDEHQELFGPEGECVLYYATKVEMVNKAQKLVINPEKLSQLRLAARERIVSGRHSYSDRLTFIISRVLS